MDLASPFGARQNVVKEPFSVSQTSAANFGPRKSDAIVNLQEFQLGASAQGDWQIE
jgi:hypothetical protein